uniref:hypothetical protein n=1 Tax=Microbulbifer agarilyticus TaxID=260552 RepID=UPI0002558684|nr:hypothetical protein [Microbulbifer agarilyticus]
MKKVLHLKRYVVIFLVTLYVFPGLFLGVKQYTDQSRTYVCNAPSEPHGYITVWMANGRNPDPEKCQVQIDGKGPWVIPKMALFGTPLIFVMAAKNYGERKMREEADRNYNDR